jgi:hypothetical protein
MVYCLCMNEFSKIGSESPDRDLARQDCREVEPNLTPEEMTECQLALEEEQEDLNRGWPGDGSGTDDLADYNANEADDYQGE